MYIYIYICCRAGRLEWVAQLYRTFSLSLVLIFNKHPGYLPVSILATWFHVLHPVLVTTAFTVCNFSWPDINYIFFFPFVTWTQPHGKRKADSVASSGHCSLKSIQLKKKLNGIFGPSKPVVLCGLLELRTKIMQIVAVRLPRWSSKHLTLP